MNESKSIFRLRGTNKKGERGWLHASSGDVTSVKDFSSRYRSLKKAKSKISELKTRFSDMMIFVDTMDGEKRIV